MTGTGTQDAPFIVDNWDDFVTAIGTDGVYVEFANSGGVIDMNQIAPEGVSDIAINCASIVGNNWTIKNLYGANSDVFIFASRKIMIDGLNFLDFYFQSSTTSSSICLFKSHNKYRHYFKNCSFTGVLYGITSCTSLYKDSNAISDFRAFTRCSFNINLKGNARLHQSISNSLRMENCYLILSGATTASYFMITLLNSYLGGSIEKTSSNKINFSNSVSSVINCYIKASGIDYGNDKTYGVLINSDKVDSAITIPDGLNAVTTEQLKDDNYLDSIGFPIGGGLNG